MERGGQAGPQHRPPTMAAAELESKLLHAIAKDGEITDSGDFASALGVDHLTLVGVIKSLISYDMISSKARNWVATTLEHL